MPIPIHFVNLRYYYTIPDRTLHQNRALLGLPVSSSSFGISASRNDKNASAWVGSNVVGISGGGWEDWRRHRTGWVPE